MTYLISIFCKGVRGNPRGWTDRRLSIGDRKQIIRGILVIGFLWASECNTPIPRRKLRTERSSELPSQYGHRNWLMKTLFWDSRRERRENPEKYPQGEEIYPGLMPWVRESAWLVLCIVSTMTIKA